ncbi:hypothetical protein SERLADRAFT_404607 [Serpula lacrymans var. lacrymans S7.9]|uniref:Uncharacterized protein n=1 Tax=Serpula lacrymans var. lacrymans (strain S7.9) TaxID=578457 RepID=F8NDW9_SERL9|nr:uncharacterized protein SERLADRAFT_404607 [Serpula lacrymans var. lacrymans S7.9]EGO30443.1 hypothetical protein SERLADRAFT_404607 [Serpula lacrymans var. lacrymans S7.9]
MELMKGVTKSICEAANSGVITWDCQYDQETMLLPYILFVAGDNPMHTEEFSHSGLKSNFFCRTCKVGGTQAQKKTDEGYNNIFKCGAARTPQETRNEILQQVDTSLKSGGTKKVKSAGTNSGIRDSTSASIVQQLLALGKQLQRHKAGKPALPESEVRQQLEQELETLLRGSTLDNHINPLLGMPAVDIHQDTPTEILHTVVLGVVKYFWGQTVWLLDKSYLLTTFQTRLESISKDGLNSGNLIGKHFKSLAQVMLYIIYDLVSQDVLDTWSVIGDLVVLLWHTKIDHTEKYLFTATAKLLAEIAANPLHHKMPSNTLLQGGTGVTLQLETGSVQVTRHKTTLLTTQSNNGYWVFIQIPRRLLKASTFITQNGDKAKLGSHVVISSPSNRANPCVGKVEEILVTEKKPRVAAYIAVTYLQFQLFQHTKLQIPILRITVAQNVLTAKRHCHGAYTFIQ